MKATLLLATSLLAAGLGAPVLAHPGHEASRVIVLVNEARSRPRPCGHGHFGPASAVTAEPRLARAAEGHAADMAKNGFFSHIGSDRSDPRERVTRTGYIWTLVGENIAAGYPGAAETVAAWLGSPGHCRIIMDARFSEAGAARVTGGRYETYWALVMARPLGAARR
ncbi:MAG: CAP domain-containing protein [Armatimonadota bacterium]|nr:CAP domain-containing protein [Armatimonadota bacterium]MDR5696621.1 CAP domain-containing protein [Armatimonadota bacterium]